MIKIQIQGVKQVQASLARIPRDLQSKAIQPALNKVAEKARAEINRAIPQEYFVKADEVRQAVSLRRSRPGSLEAVIEVFGSKSRRGRSANMIRFLAAVQALGKAIKTRGAKASKGDLAALGQQLGFMIKRAGGMKKIDGAFIGNKGRTVFRRIAGTTMSTRSKYGGTKNAEEIEPMQVIGFSQMFNSRKINQRIRDKINTELPIEIERAIKLVLAR